MSAGSSGRACLPVGAAVPSLVRWGLSSDADLVYRTIVTLGPGSVRALGLELGLPIRRVDDALLELRTVGAAVSVSEDRRSSREPPVWVARPPTHVVTSLRNRRFRPINEEMQARTHQAVVFSLSQRAGVQAALPAVAGQLGDGVRYLASRAATRQRLAELMAVEQAEHLAINTEQVFDAASARAGWPLAQEIVDRGVRVRVLSRPPADGDRQVEPAVVHQSIFGRRFSPQVPMKLIVIDHRVALFPADPRDFERGYLEVSQPAAVRALVSLFERHWTAACDPREHGLPEVVLSHRERELVNLLARGHTDLSAAAQLKISARSVTNILRALMDQLGVDNRFQLGLALGAARAAAPPAPPATKENQ